MLYSCLFERNQPDLVVYLYMFDHDGIGSQLSLLFFFCILKKKRTKPQSFPSLLVCARVAGKRI